jgi:phosphate transport system protein
MRHSVERHFDQDLQQLKEKLLTMGSLAESMIHSAIKALVDRKVELTADVYRHESEVNGLQIEVDDRCMKMIALHQPAARDLRFIAAAMKINSDLERIADQAVNISQTTEFLLQEPQLKPLIDVPRMAEIAKKMLKDALDAFVDRDENLARSVLVRDDQVDELKHQMFRELLTYMISDPSTIKRGIDLILISRNLERIADHATNIAEDVIFVACGKDIRHGAENRPESSLPTA